MKSSHFVRLAQRLIAGVEYDTRRDISRCLRAQAPAGFGCVICISSRRGNVDLWGISAIASRYAER